MSSKLAFTVSPTYLSLSSSSAFLLESGSSVSHNFFGTNMSLQMLHHNQHESFLNHFHHQPDHLNGCLSSFGSSFTFFSVFIFLLDFLVFLPQSFLFGLIPQTQRDLTTLLKNFSKQFQLTFKCVCELFKTVSQTRL